MNKRTLKRHPGAAQPNPGSLKIVGVLILLFTAYFSVSQVNVGIHIFEEDKRNTTPAMVCISDVNNNIVVIPPLGKPAPVPTYPDPFFKGINYSNDRNWVGPVRRMNGKGEVNGQRTYVYGNNSTLPYFKDSIIYQVSGDFTIQLYPGKYKISIEHGNEYVPVEEFFTIYTTEQSVHHSFLLKRWIDLPARGWYSGDVHVHHALNKPEFKEYMMQMARAENVHVVNMLEMGDRYATHFKSPSFGPHSSVCANDICLAFGQEEPRSDYGHIIGLNIDTLARDTAEYNHYDIVFNKIHQSKTALTGYAHFAYNGEGITKGMALYAPTKQIDFVELMQNTQINQQDYYDYLNIGFRISAAAGSDFPWGSTIGDCRTFVYTGNKFSVQNWFAGLKAGKTFVSNGPALFLEVNGQIPGSEIKASSNANITINVKALSQQKIGLIKKIEIYNNDGRLLEYQTNTDSITISKIIKANKSQWITAAVFCESGAIAHTSPVYIIVDNQPVFDKTRAPAIIAKKLKLLDQIVSDENAKPVPDQGVLQRVEKARYCYENLK
jgi:hypothetical protein